MWKSDYAFGHASGNSANDCHLLLYRSPEGQPFEPDGGESWIIRIDDDGMTSIMKHAGWYTALWRAPSGRAYVTEASGHIQSMSKSTADLTSHELGGVMRGVWGLDDDHIWAWGSREDDDFIVRLQGDEWMEMTAPGGSVLSLHGRAEDDLWIVGGDGNAAHWNGKRWTKIPSPTKEYLVSVFADQEGRVWACGAGGSLLEVKKNKLARVLQHDSALQSIAVWDDDLWIGATGDVALCSLHEGELYERQDEYAGALLEAGSGLLVSAGSTLAFTANGEDYECLEASDVGELCDDSEPPWKE